MVLQLWRCVWSHVPNWEEKLRKHSPSTPRNATPASLTGCFLRASGRQGNGDKLEEGKNWSYLTQRLVGKARHTPGSLQGSPGSLAWVGKAVRIALPQLSRFSSQALLGGGCHVCPVDGDLDALGGERAQRGERGGLAGWEGGKQGCFVMMWYRAQWDLGRQGRGGSAESTQASRGSERCAQRPGSRSVCVGEQQATLFGQQFQMQNGESRADNTAKRDNFPTSFIQMLRSLPECRKRAFQYSFL